MKYNKNISLGANLYLLKNKIENNIKYSFYNSEQAAPFVPKSLEYKPKITFVIMGEGNSAYNSLINQSYVNIAVTKYEHFDFENINSDYIAFVNANDTYYNNAVYNMAEALQGKKYDMVYCDEDIGDKHFYKPDWSPDTLKSINYIGMAMVKAEYVKKFDSYYDFLIELTNKDLTVYHISKTLYSSKRKIEAGKIALPEINDKISIIIPSKDNYAVLKRCIDSIRQKSTYKNYEIIVVDNGSKDKTPYAELCDKYIYDKYDFNFSKMCNIGADNAEGEYLLFLNDDTEVITENWMELMAAHGSQKNTGAVGAKLIYPNSDIIQHCGIVNILHGPVHYFTGYSDKDSLYFGRNRYTYNVSAVTAACMLIKKEKFFGFDEGFKIAYNDVDICFSLIERGYSNVMVNDVKLYHYESVSRGDDKADKAKLKRLAEEKNALYNKHKGFCCNDKYYNANLTLRRGDFTQKNIKPAIPQKFIEGSHKPMDCNIEYLYSRDNILHIGGYLKSKGYCKIYVVIESDQKYIARADNEVRQDISLLYGKGYSLSGFSAVIDIGRLKNIEGVRIIAVNKYGKSHEYKYCNNKLGF